MPHVINICVNGNDERHTIMSRADIIELIGQTMGYEFAGLVEAEMKMPPMKELSDEWKEEFLERFTDYYSYESTIDDNNSSFCEIRDLTDELLTHLTNDKRLDRDKILKAVDRVNTVAVLSI